MAFLIIWSSYAILIGIYKGLGIHQSAALFTFLINFGVSIPLAIFMKERAQMYFKLNEYKYLKWVHDICLLYTSPSPRDRTRSRMPSSA